MDARQFRRDVESAPGSLRDLAARLADDDPWAFVDPSNVRRVLLLGMGSSAYAGGVVARRLRAVGVDAVCELSSAAASFPPGPGTIVVAVSATGGSVETLEAAARYAGSAVTLVGLTNAPTSGLTELSDYVVDLAAGASAGGLAGRTYRHTLVLLLALAERLTGGVDALAAAVRGAEATESLLGSAPQWLPRAADVLDGPDGLYCLAPAERLGSAQQSALMVRQGPRRAATGCETGDWAHVDVYLAKTLAYRALAFPGSRWDGRAVDWLVRRRATVLPVGPGMDGIHGVLPAVRYRHDAHPDARLIAEVTVAELVAARWWSADG